MKIFICKKKYRQCIPISKEKYDLENTDQLLNLMQIYLSEWMHRDSLLWKQIFTYFFVLNQCIYWCIIIC